MHVLYLHGFTSSADSSKARFLAERLAAFGLPLHAPDFNLPDFSTLTTTRMLEQVEALMASLDPGPVALIGSSLGAYVAWHAAAQAARWPSGPTHPVTHLVLMAPAFDFGTKPMAGVGQAEVDEWQRTGSREFFHWGYNEPRQVGYALFDDARRYLSADVDVTTPALVFQGRRDALVDADSIRAFVATRPSMTLCELDDDHQLHASLPVIWDRTAAFLGLDAR